MRQFTSGLLLAAISLSFASLPSWASDSATLRETRGLSVHVKPPPAAAEPSPGEVWAPDREPGAPHSSAPLWFRDVTEEADLTLPPGLYFGGTWADLDGDDDLDLTIPLDSDFSSCLRIWRNDGGRFSDVTEAFGIGCVPFVRSVAWIDLDEDGDLDLFLTRRSSASTNLVFENREGRLVPAATTGLELPATDVTQAWADFDGDGDLDLYLPGVILAPQRLFLREGPFQFRDASAEVGLDPDLVALAGAWADYDDDGDPDLAVGLGDGIRLYRNDDGVLLVDVTGDGAGVRGFLVVPSWGDVDADGDLDLLAGGFFPPRLLENRTTDGGTNFVDRTEDWGSGYAGSTGGGWADLDLDGDLDLLDDGGTSGPHLYRNGIPQGGRLVDVSREVGLPETPGVGWQPIAGDFDGDGQLDFFVPHEAGRALYRNEGAPAGRWVTLRLLNASGAPAIGARVRYEAGPRLQVREVAFPGVGFGFAPTDVPLALGWRGAAAPVEVRWPSGAVELFHGLPAGRLHILQEGAGPARAPRPVDSPPHRIVADCNPCREPVRFSLPGGNAPSATKLSLYDARGRLVRELVVGSASVTWDLRDARGQAVPPGAYWALHRAAGQELRTRIVVLR